MTGNARLCEMFQEFRKSMNGLLRLEDLMETNFEFDLDADLFRKDFAEAKERIAELRERLENICGEL